MKNHFIYLIGIIILIITVWLTTMAGINVNKKQVQEDEVCISSIVEEVFDKEIVIAKLN